MRGPTRVGEEAGHSAIQEFGQSWRVLCAAVLGIGVCWIPFYTAGVFMLPISTGLGWSLSAMTGPGILGTVGIIVGAPITGRLMDRFGARYVILCFVPCWALSVAATNFIANGIWIWYLVAFFSGFVSTAGPGAFARVINSWFDAGRGTALGVMLMGFGLSFAVGPRLMEFVIDAHGWRVGYLFMAAIALLAWPLAYCWVHERQEAKPTLRTPTSDLGYIGYTRREAMRLPVFWLLIGALFLLYMCGAGMVFLVPFLSQAGMSRVTAATYLSLVGVACALGRPLVGFIIDFLPAPFVAACTFLLNAIGLSILGLLRTRYVFLGASMIGVAYGAQASCFSYCIARYFGMKALGEISGLFLIVQSSGASLGALLFSLLHDMTGAYTVSYLTAAGFAVGSACLMAAAGRYRFLERIA